MLNKNNDDRMADSRLEQVLNAIKNQDRDALMEIFSTKALHEAEDFDANVESLFMFLKGNIETYAQLSSPSSSDTIISGRVTKKKINSYYCLNTDKQQYFFLLVDFPIDMDSPDNVGLYLMLVVKAEDEEKIYDGDQKILYDGNKSIPHAGIYLPLMD